MSSAMQLAQINLDLVHARMIATEQALTDARANLKVIAREEARTRPRGHMKVRALEYDLEHARTTSRSSMEVRAIEYDLEHARTCEREDMEYARTGRIYTQMRNAEYQNMLCFMAHRTSESAYAEALESFNFQQAAQE